MSTIKEQRMNTYLALGVLAGVIAVVCVIGILTFHKETEYLQGQAEVTEYLYNQERGGRVIIDDALKAAIDAYYEQYGAKE